MVTRKENLQKLKKKWYDDVFKPLKGEEKIQHDLAGLKEYLSQMEWNTNPIDEEMLNALIRRGIRLKEARENQQVVDWATVKSSSLARHFGNCKIRDGLEKTKKGKNEKGVDLESTVELISKMPVCDLKQLLVDAGDKKQVALYRFD